MRLSERLKSIKDEGYIERTLMELEKADHIMVFGAGSRAQILAQFLQEHGIVIEAFLVNQNYYTEGKRIGINNRSIEIQCYEREVEDKTNLTIVLGISQSIIDMHIFDKPSICNVIPISIGVREDYLLKREFYLEHMKEFDWLYDLLEDEISREYLYVHLCGRLTGKDVPFEPDCCPEPQYIFEEFMEWGEYECYVDCGAYTGDSLEEFMNKMPSRIVKAFTAYALEPDEENFKRLNSKYSYDNRIQCLCLGTYSKKGQLSFSNGEGELSAISNFGESIIEVDSIDNILGNEKATFIKMDIEGSELEALKGAREQITRYTPRLAICVYHRKEDLYEIPRLIMDYNPGYRFYLRIHQSMPTELTLFCMPKRINSA